MSTKIYDRKGNLLREEPDTQRHPLGPGARNHLGQHIDGPLAGTWEQNSTDAPWYTGSRANRIFTAIKSIKASEKDAWMTSGKPKVEAIEKKLGEEISQFERNAIWAWMKADEANAAAKAKAEQAAEAAEAQLRVDAGIEPPAAPDTTTDPKKGSR